MDSIVAVVTSLPGFEAVEENFPRQMPIRLNPFLDPSARTLPCLARAPYRGAVCLPAETLVQEEYTPDQRPDKLRPLLHWCEGQPACETGSGQA